jgi:pyruvate dehydrogenase E1 component alpha subunit
MYDPELYRDKQEVEEWKKRDPITTFAQRMKEQDLWKEDWARMEEEVARKSPKRWICRSRHLGAVGELTRFVYSEERRDDR